MFQQGDEEVTDRMLPEVGRDVADSKPPVGDALILMLDSRVHQRMCVPVRPCSMFHQDRFGINIRVKVQ